MKIVKPIEGKKWQIPCVVDPKGRIIYNTEYVPGAWKDDLTRPYKRGDGSIIGYSQKYEPEPGWSKTKVDPFIFTATIIPEGYGRGRSSVWFSYKDADDEKQTYSTGPQGSYEMLNAVTSGDFRAEQGKVTGTFHWVKQGREIYIMPYTDEVL